MASRHVLVCLPPHAAETAYTLDTRLRRALNKVRGGHFDSYEITTGRYTGHFPLIPGAPADDPRLVRPASGPADRCAGGVLSLLDLPALRDRRATEAATLYDAWKQATDGMPPADPWERFEQQWGGDSFQALLGFRAQRQLKVLDMIKPGPRQRGEEVALVRLDRTGFIDRARRRAVPGSSLRELDGTWTTDPAWLNSDDAFETGSTAYYDHVNAYIDARGADFLVVGVDCRR
ncbi:hypothetical protein [Streptomyces sp. RKAG337]|uniref:hypothetical protein n=1 Tax=Streptomyces sp. RKAG337 TaxID=2893404 RepID=UPI002033C125|nr:hypothetical protein [Streptomyces sp. RKAG337]MCM2430939.1 hypothetical protein [Streptomyces sp. RKAG337]